VRPPHRTLHLLGALLLVAMGVSMTGAAPAQAASPTPLDRVIPAPASVAPGGSPYRVTRGTHIHVDGSREAR
jgi:hexosaminidase